MNRILLCVVLVLSVASSANGDQIIIPFATDTTHNVMRSSIFRPNPNSNFGGGGASATQLLGAPGTSNPCDALYYFKLDDCLTGATITSAVFTVKDTWYNPDNLPNVEVRRLTGPPSALWAQGDGTWATRWNRHNGVGMWYANFDNIAATGVDWKGNTTPYGSHDVTAVWPLPVADLIDNGIAYGQGLWTTFDITSLVQMWANGTWENKGFTLYCGNMPSGTVGSPMLGAPTITINFTPAIPEPGTMALIGTGAVAFLTYLRRRRMK